MTGVPTMAGVAALFNADLHAGCPEWAPRTDWVLVWSWREGRWRLVYDPKPT